MTNTNDGKLFYLRNYESLRQSLETAVRDAAWSSMQAAGRKAGPRRYWSSTVFTRFCTHARSLLSLCPPTIDNPVSNWDFAAVASLTRNLFEAYLLLRYFCEPTDGEEWSARLNLMQLSDCVSRMKVFEQLQDHQASVAFLPHAVELRGRLETNSYFQSLDPSLQKRLLQGHRPSIFTNRELADKFGVEAKVWGYFELLSSHAHTLPLSFYRTAEQRRTGVANEVDVTYIASAMEFDRDLTQNARGAFEEDFADTVKFKSTSQSIEALLMDQLGNPSTVMNRAQRRVASKKIRRRR
jgi:hypothetical protein